MKDSPALTREIVAAARKYMGISARALADAADVSARKLRETMREDPNRRWLDYAEIGELRLAFFNLDVDWWGPEALAKGVAWSYSREGGAHQWTSPEGERVEVLGESGHPKRLMGVMGAKPDGALYVLLGWAGASHLRMLAQRHPARP